MHRMFRFVALTLGFAAITSIMLCAPIKTKNPKIAPDCETIPPSGNLAVIVQYINDPGVEEENAVANLGGSVRTRLHSIKADAVTLPHSTLERLAANPNVRYISKDRPVGARSTVTITAAEYTVEPINAPAVWAKGYIGTNVGVAVLDSGISPDPDLSTDPVRLLPPGQPTALKFANVPGEVAPGNNGRIAYSQNFVPGQNDANDHYGHGTHVAGLIAGNGAKSTGKNFFRTFYGAAPNANLINLRVLDANGAGTDSSVIAGIEAAISLKSTYNIRIINLSLGRPIWESYTLDPLCQAVEQADRKSVV